jgi:hypothetical protein
MGISGVNDEPNGKHDFYHGWRFRHRARLKEYGWGPTASLAREIMKGFELTAPHADVLDSGKSCSSRSSRFLILLLMLDFGSFRVFPAAVRLFNSTDLIKHSISLRLRIFTLRKIVEKEIDRRVADDSGVNDDNGLTRS